MKKCLKSPTEPVCLTNFRTANPKGTWDEFRNQDPVCYLSIRILTGKDQCGLCAYCEIRLNSDNEQIAHFHPKSDASTEINWALGWNNLWLACKGGTQSWLQNSHHYLPPLPANRSCDENKEDKIVDGTVLSPQDILAFPRLFSYQQFSGGIFICVDENECISAGIDAEKAKQTIKEFNLNCTRLVLARLALYKQLEFAIKILRDSKYNAQLGFEALARKHLSKNTNGHWPEFFTLIRWRFGKTAESHLQSIEYLG
jgi:uncharacterized protein (TIGR02646 family)